MARVDIDELYDQLQPLRPLEATEIELYVDWQSRLKEADDVKRRISHSISYSRRPTIRLFTGHRGMGKTTELNRIRQILTHGRAGRPFFVTTLNASERLDFDDLQPQDVVFQMACQLIDDLRAAGFSHGEAALANWWGRFRDLFRGEVGVKGVELGVNPLKVSFTREAFPSDRAEFRRVLRGRLPALHELVNDHVLKPARSWLRIPENGGFDDILIVVDDLDQIPQRALTEQGLTNHENLFLDHATALKAMKCSILYTLPIELAYSACRTRLEDEYGDAIFVLPTIPVSTRDGLTHPEGIGVLREIVERRARSAGAAAPTDLFETADLLEDIIRASGGHPRGLFRSLRTMLDRVDGVPITRPDAERVLNRTANELARPLRAEDWELLQKVHDRKQPVGSEEWWNSAIKNRFVFTYEDESGYWYDRHPLLDRVHTFDQR
jgi:hypothetical protein